MTGQLAVLPDPSGLLAAIMSNPAEDTPRLEYADWLDEQDPGSETCSLCDGTGSWVTYAYSNPPEEEPCPSCNATGQTRDPSNGYRAAVIRMQIEIASLVRGALRASAYSDWPDGNGGFRIEASGFHGGEPGRSDFRLLLAHNTETLELDVRPESWRVDRASGRWALHGTAPAKKTIGGPQLYELERRVFQLQVDSRQRLAVFDGGGDYSVQSERGFISRVVCTWDEWAARGEKLRAREWCPLVALRTWPTGYAADGSLSRELFVAHVASELTARYPGTAFLLPDPPAVTLSVHSGPLFEDGQQKAGVTLSAGIRFVYLTAYQASQLADECRPRHPDLAAQLDEAAESVDNLTRFDGPLGPCEEIQPAPNGYATARAMVAALDTF